MKQSLYQFIIKHIDEDGVFTPDYLPDIEDNGIPQMLGFQDANIYTMNIPTNIQDASKLVKALRDYMQEPLQPQRQKLYQLTRTVQIAECCDSFINAITQDDITPQAFDLARRFFYNARHREPLKFAYLIFGIYGMERIQAEDTILWQDLATVAHCEEFTFHFLFACRINGFISQKKVWELMGCTKGWGKVFAIIDCQCRTDAERRWLLRNGPDTSVDYPPLAVNLIEATHLSEWLAIDDLEPELYNSAVHIIGNYILMLNRFTNKVINEQFNLADINLSKLLHALLAHCERLANTEELPAGYTIDAINLSIALRELQADQNYMALSFNDLQLLLAQCDKIIYARNWEKIVAAELIKDNKINYQIADIAMETDIDIWPILYDYWQKQPEEIDLLPYLLAFDGDQRSERVLKFIANNTTIYAGIEKGFLVPLHYLITHDVDYGDEIIIAALTGIYDWPRGIACSVLTAWQNWGKTPSEAVHKALLKGRGLCKIPVITEHIDSLLAGEEFSVEQFLKESM